MTSNSESTRLNYQHFLITQLTDNDLLHQFTRGRVELATPHQVADIGTGTAIWPISLAHSLPHWQIDGFDISGDQYPVDAWLPPNVNLHKHDAFQSFPEEYHGKYDIVNVRFFMTLLNGHNVHQFLRNVMMLLKPGGLFQWLDIDAPSVKAIGPEGISLALTSKVATMMQTTPPDAASWITHDGEMVRPVGLEPITRDQLRFRDQHRPIWNQCVLMGLEEVTHGLEQSDTEANRAKASGLRELLKGLSSEFEKGASLDTPWLYLVARKPL
ncbi:uncharacterized protein N7484_010242 [Penicillium longicatenatum]|uniref:uncharacterized protein n=1 Tax=Penicillium longicatenatum TaxID=1561947 RepID=UPI002546A048|nr:uncharacterized protein N7484_010242 [Penicillium longicatenatum]KAJ5636929.1 hypothetical protein N7484_010242 [Penicillium longicatenatum]